MDAIFNLLQQSLLDAKVIEQNIRATNSMETDIAAAIEARVKHEELREEHRQHGGLSTFREWLEGRA